MKTEQMKREKDELSEDSFDEESYFRCPITLQDVNPDVVLENTRLKEAIMDYLRQNPWAHQFYSRRSLLKT